MLGTFGKNAMNCEQVEAIVLDLDRVDGAESLERAAALAHLSHCSRCAALQESWQAAREELRALGEDTLEARAPARVEMRLRQEFRTRHRTMVARRAGLVAAWALAAAAVLVGTVSWWNWRQGRRGFGRVYASAGSRGGRDRRGFDLARADAARLAWRAGLAGE